MILIPSPFSDNHICNILLPDYVCDHIRDIAATYVICYDSGLTDIVQCKKCIISLHTKRAVMKSIYITFFCIKVVNIECLNIVKLKLKT